MPEALDRLDFTRDQRRSADSILERSAPRANGVMRSMIPQVAAIADSVNAELRQIRTPAQRATFDSVSGNRLLLSRLRGENAWIRCTGGDSA